MIEQTTAIVPVQEVICTERVIEIMKEKYDAQAANNVLDRIFADPAMDKVKKSFNDIFATTTTQSSQEN